MAEHTITIQDFQFNPPTGEPVVIAVGDSVKWVNRDSTPHNAEREESPTFATKLLDKDETSDPIVFDQATGAEGIEYFCRPHSSFMKGKLIVTLLGSHLGTYTREQALRTHADHSRKKK